MSTGSRRAWAVPGNADRLRRSAPNEGPRLGGVLSRARPALGPPPRSVGRRRTRSMWSGRTPPPEPAARTARRLKRSTRSLAEASSYPSSPRAEEAPLMRRPNPRGDSGRAGCPACHDSLPYHRPPPCDVASAPTASSRQTAGDRRPRCARIASDLSQNRDFSEWTQLPQIAGSEATPPLSNPMRSRRRATDGYQHRQAPAGAPPRRTN